MPRLSIRGLGKSFRRSNGGVFQAVDNVSVDVGRGEFLILLGPSGCGKTTLLRCVAGLESPDTGSIHLEGEPLYDSAANIDVPPERRGIGMVFQSYALWPHMTVAENVGFPLKVHGVARAEIDDKVDAMLRSMNIAELAGQHPGQISGGQQQRVALARALVTGHDLILFDEPLSNVDAKVREHLRLELLELQRRFAFTALYVTHDQEEAMALATHIAVMRSGRIVQIAPPHDIYRHPATRYVSQFVGTANEIHGVAAGGEIRTAFGTIAPAAGLAAGDVILVSRPEDWQIGDHAPPGTLSLRGEVTAVAFLGSHHDVVVRTAASDVTVRLYGRRPPPAPQQTVCCYVAAADVVIVAAD